jgi:formylglycine-generating enzyme required for sulfatase activity
VQPSDAVLFVDGKKFGRVPRQLKLNAVEHKVLLKKKGYDSFSTKITPRPGFPQEISTILKKKGTQSSGSASKILAKNGYPLKLIPPGVFTMGASRREQGRRPNETLRNIVLKRPFYMGTREVTNKEFREFLSNHNASSYRGRRLDNDDLPVVQVTWEQAAMFCNWLSAKEMLAPVYRIEGETVFASDLSAKGYRLPTEAEWEYCARVKKNGNLLKYPWGKKFPPIAASGNFADRSAKGVLSSYLKNYDDGYVVTAPPARFSPNEFGLYDMGGNVAEWCHDYYAIYSSSDKMTVDPSGPDGGKHRVVRGSSWKDASIGALRLSFRDYSDRKREYIGFRVCRYAE